MTNIRRYPARGRPVFMTIVCRDRKSFLREDDRKRQLLEVIREVKSEKPFSMQAYVILDDHWHWIVKSASGDFSKIVQSVKMRFTHGLKKRLHHSGKLTVWQRRFWDHIIRDEDDLERHMDYSHYNPVRHAYVQRPVGYPWSSLGEYVKRGKYSTQWGAKREPENLAEMALE